MHDDATDALDGQAITQVIEKQWLIGHFLDHARFAGCHLADDRAEHWGAAVGDRRHPHRHVVALQRHIAVALAERRFGLEPLRIDEALDDDLDIGRHQEIDRPGLDDAHRRARESARHRKLIKVDGELLRAGENHHRCGADRDRDRHRSAALVVFKPVIIAAGAARGARHHAYRQPIGRLQGGPVHAHVLDAVVGIAGDAQRRRKIRRGIEARRRYRHRQLGESAARPAQIVAAEDHLLARRRRDLHRRDRIGDSLHPGLTDIRHRLTHADRVDVGRCRERADGHREVVAPAPAVDHVGEQERAPLVLRNAAEKLPAHQRMQLGILVDRAI